MGKLTRMITSLIIIDIIFIITGQIDLNSTTSLISNLISNPSLVRTSLFFGLFLGIAGIASLVATSSVSSGIVSRGADIIAFTAMALAMAALLGDFVTIFITLSQHNTVLATLIMAPIIALFVMTIAEWLRGKD